MSAGQLRGIKSRIKSVENTRKITRAMEMVSAAKLRRFQGFLTKARPYTTELEKMMLRLVDAQNSQAPDQGAEKKPSYEHPFFAPRTENQTSLLLVTADSGLCGPHNMLLIEMARDFLKRSQKPAPVIFAVGKAGVNALRRSSFSCEKTWADIRQNQIDSAVKEIKETLASAYTEGRVDSVYVIHSKLLSVTASKPATEKILPLSSPQSSATTADSKDNVPYIFEPSPEAIFERIVPEYFEAKVRMLLLESFVSEQMARMTAMHQATKNAKEMIDSLVLVRNKIRQAIITKEIIEIISGSRAAKN
ncbi:MAG: ATP synthase F1 subunit gamma [Omnitrophica bacterium GWA2_52_12]|nr:MAG: ATP synthase F1 subunit gamma [Omnitrophica bacterium GWA2_52_12]